MLVTAPSPIIGHDKCTKLAHYAHEDDLSLREANQALKFLSDEEFQKVSGDHDKTRRSIATPLEENRRRLAVRS